MNFELRGHIVRNAEPKKKEGKRPSEKRPKSFHRSNLLRRKSIDMQGIDSSLKAVKTDGYTEGHAGQVPACSGQTSV